MSDMYLHTVKLDTPDLDLIVEALDRFIDTDIDNSKLDNAWGVMEYIKGVKRNGNL